jgi:radical SAM superfamily enzyme YgiQ (UPF0313 family)
VNYPLGLGIISSVLKQKGHETKILHFNEEIDSPLDMDVLEKTIVDFSPQLIGFSSTSNQFQYVKQMTDVIKQKRDIPTLVGGIHATIAPEKVLQTGTVDMICMGEGELSIFELADKIEKGEDYTTIQNLGFRENSGLKLNPIRPLLDAEALDALPFSDREGFNFGKIVEKKHGWANVMSSRGCLNKCSYCVNHYFHKMYSPLHKTFENLRYRKVSSVLRETKELLDRYPDIRLINFVDDNITLNRKWLEEVCEEYPGKIGLPFACNVHPAKFDQNDAQMLARAGCVEVKIGIESGSERLRKEVLRRPGREDIMVNAFRAAEGAGIRAWSFNMIGIPTETPEEMLLTAKLNARIRPYIVRCSIFFPYEGTDLYHHAIEHNLIQEDRTETVSSHLEDSILNMPQLSREEIVRFKAMFKWYVDAYSDIEAASLFKTLIDLFERLPKEKWLSGEGQKLFNKMDVALDDLLREMRIEHYATRRHLDLNFTKKLNFELP